jgi:23S rRNA pseudouridine1911/1915/1917 synthase
MKPSGKPIVLLDRLQRQFPSAKRQTLKRMVQNRRVKINGLAAQRLNQSIKEADTIEVVSVKSSPAPKLDFAIVYEDADMIVIDKPRGLLTSTVPREPRPTALAMLRQYLARREPSAKLGLIHRLDRDACGLLVFSKNSRAFASLKRQFFKHSVSRIYHAVVSPPPKRENGKLESRLTEHADGSVHSTRAASRGQRAITEYSVIRSDGKTAALRVTLHTGRKHQIRAHLCEAGSPIVGDTMYGGSPGATGLMLAAVELHLDHPRTGERMMFTVQPFPPSRAAQLS